MEYIKIAKVKDVQLLRRASPAWGTLHLTAHHLIFCSEYVPNFPSKNEKSKADSGINRGSPSSEVQTGTSKIARNADQQRGLSEGDGYMSPKPEILPLAIPDTRAAVSPGSEVWISYPVIHTVDMRRGHHPNYISQESAREYENNLENTHHMSLPERLNELHLNHADGHREHDRRHEGHPGEHIPGQAPSSTLLRIRCRDFTFICLQFKLESECMAVYETIMKLTCLSSIDSLYAFFYAPGNLEKDINTWKLYDARKEYERMGISFDSDDTQQVRAPENRWRITDLNTTYTFCPTYCANLVVPECISDNVLSYAARFRSKSRIPALSYFYSLNGCSITRSAQPLVGLKNSRSRQDEALVEAIFLSTVREDVYGGGSQDNLIVDARPTTNAMAQTALGAGTESMDNYRFARKVYLGIDNIHVMRESLNRVVEALRDGDISPFPPRRDLLLRSGWLKHLQTILEGAVLIAKQVAVNHSHVLVHCSDGWDRTAQLCSLSQIFLDPYYRTFDGFIMLVEKEWLSFGFRFAERAGYLNSERHFRISGDVASTGSAAHQALSSVGKFVNLQTGPGAAAHRRQTKYTSPVFHQFLDCVYQVLIQEPEKFQFTERFLRRLLYHSFSCQYGSFLYNCERERVEADACDRTRCVWDYFVARKHEFINKDYKGLDGSQIAKNKQYAISKDLLFPVCSSVRWWAEAFGRTQDEMNIVVPLRPSEFKSQSVSPIKMQNQKSPSSMDEVESEEETENNNKNEMNETQENIPETRPSDEVVDDYTFSAHEKCDIPSLGLLSGARQQQQQESELETKFEVDEKKDHPSTGEGGGGGGASLWNRGRNKSDMVEMKML